MSISIEPLKGTIDGKEYFLELGTIKDTMLGREDHGIFTYVLRFDFKGSTQGAGTYCLSEPENFGKHLQAVLDFFGCDWEKIKGGQAYVLREKPYDSIQGLLRVDQSKYLIFTEVLNG